MSAPKPEKNSRSEAETANGWLPTGRAQRGKSLESWIWDAACSIRGNERVEYGKEILQTLSAKMAGEFRYGFSRQNLSDMITFAEVFPEAERVATLSRQLGRSHCKEIIPLTADLQRDFYAENRTTVSAIELALPSREEQQESACVLEAIGDLTEGAGRTKTQLQDLFRNLLHELMTAQTRVHTCALPLSK